MRNTRKWNEIREIRITSDFTPRADGSVLIEMGNTRLICAVSVSDDVPDHAKNRGMGWLSADYTMLPYSTSPRKSRGSLKPDSRSTEIKRLIGRSLRGAINLAKTPGLSFQVDCDVIEADGGTRTTAITGATVALQHAVSRLLAEERLDENPLTHQVAALSAGYVGSELLVDLQYSEDSRARMDCNIVMNDAMEFLEIQGTGEDGAFSREEMDAIVDAVSTPMIQLFDIQKDHFR